jgi:hypothetical protein
MILAPKTPPLPKAATPFASLLTQPKPKVATGESIVEVMANTMKNKTKLE